MVVGITGAGGFVGRLLTQTLRDRGHRVVAFSSSGRSATGEPARPYDLDAAVDPGSLDGLDALIHAAYVPATAARSDAGERNIAGTMRLFEAAHAAGVPFVFLSSLSARADASSAYGRQKYALEMQLAGTGAIVLRPGLVAGDGGLLRNLAAALRRGVVPLVDGGRQRVYVIGGDDLASAIEMSLADRLAGRITVCSGDSVALSHIAETMALRLRVRFRFLSVPWRLAYAVAWSAERCGIALPLTTENLLGMRGAPPEAPSAALIARGWHARSWDELLPALSFAAGEPS